MSSVWHKLQQVEKRIRLSKQTKPWRREYSIDKKIRKIQRKSDLLHKQDKRKEIAKKQETFIKKLSELEPETDKSLKLVSDLVCENCRHKIDYVVKLKRIKNKVKRVEQFVAEARDNRERLKTFLRNIKQFKGKVPSGSIYQTLEKVLKEKNLGEVERNMIWKCFEYDGPIDEFLKKGDNIIEKIVESLDFINETNDVNLFLNNYELFNKVLNF